MKIYTVYYKWPFGTICNIFCGKRYTYFFNEIFYNSKLYNKMIDLWIMKIYCLPKLCLHISASQGDLLYTNSVGMEFKSEVSSVLDSMPKSRE